MRSSDVACDQECTQPRTMQKNAVRWSHRDPRACSKCAAGHRSATGCHAVQTQTPLFSLRAVRLVHVAEGVTSVARSRDAACPCSAGRVRSLPSSPVRSRRSGPPAHRWIVLRTPLLPTTTTTSTDDAGGTDSGGNATTSGLDDGTGTARPDPGPRATAPHLPRTVGPRARQPTTAEVVNVTKGRPEPSIPVVPEPVQIDLVTAGAKKLSPSTPSRVTWAQRLARVFAIDILKCSRPGCGGSRDSLVVTRRPRSSCAATF